MSTSAHWDDAFARRGSSAVSWHEETPAVSLEIVSALRVPSRTAVVDIGGGASRFARELAARGFDDVSVLDLSEVALAEAAAPGVEAIHADVLAWRPERTYGLWHDRALLHFFTEEPDRDAYLRTLDEAVAPGGHVVLGVFALDGPETCSGLPVRRYGAAELGGLLGRRFELLLERRETHVTPGGARQPFTCAAFERVA